VSTPPRPALSAPPRGDEKAKIPEATKEYWREEGDKLYSARRYQEAVVAYERGLQIAPNDTILRTKYNKTHDYLSKPALKYLYTPDQDQERFRIRRGLLIGAAITILLFLMVNALAQWNTSTSTITTIIGLIVLGALAYVFIANEGL